jgi:hypothetical protein
MIARYHTSPCVVARGSGFASLGRRQTVGRARRDRQASRIAVLSRPRRQLAVRAFAADHAFLGGLLHRSSIHN